MLCEGKRFGNTILIVPPIIIRPHTDHLYIRTLPEHILNVLHLLIKSDNADTSTILRHDFALVKTISHSTSASEEEVNPEI